MAAGVAVVSADLLQHLREEVSSASVSPVRQLAGDRRALAAASPSQPRLPGAGAKGSPGRPQAPGRSEAPSPNAESAAAARSPAAVRQARRPSAARPRVTDTAVGSSMPLEEVLRRAALASAEPEDMAEAERSRTQSTQTAAAAAVATLEPAAHQPVAELPTSQVTSPASRPYAIDAEGSVQMSARGRTPAAQESPHSLGRCDLFGNDTYHVEKEKERRRLQAQMLAEQIEEQKRRKEEEKRKRKQQELEEEQRIEREQRELQERHEREQRQRAAVVDVASPPSQAAPTVEPRDEPAHVREAPTRQPRRRTLEAADRTVTEAGVTGPIARQLSNSTEAADAQGNSTATGAPRRRRRRRTSASSGTTWRSQRTWRDKDIDSVGFHTPDLRAQSQSPPPWLSATAQETPMATRTAPRDKDLEVLSPVRETVPEMQKTVERQRRRRTRDRMRERDRERDDRAGDRQDRSYEDQWMSAARTPGDTRASQWRHRDRDRDGDEPRRRRRPAAGVGAGHAQADDVAAPVPGFDGRPSPKMSEEDLRVQLGSLVKLCEQLLVERAERDRVDRERAERSDRAVASGHGRVVASGHGRAVASGHGRGGGRRSDRSERSPPAAPVSQSGAGGGGSARGAESRSARSHSHGAESRSARASSHHDERSGVAPGDLLHRGGRDEEGDLEQLLRHEVLPVDGRLPPGVEDGGHRSRSLGGHSSHSGHGGRSPSKDRSPDRRRRPSADRSPAPLPGGRAPPAMPAAVPVLGGGEVGCDGWPPDALAGLVAEAVGGHGHAGNAAAIQRARPYRLTDIEEQPSPFAAPNARGLAMQRRHSQMGSGPRLFGPSSPPPVSRGGLNLQANWPAFGRSLEGGPSDEYSGVFGGPLAYGAPQYTPNAAALGGLNGRGMGGSMADDDRYSPLVPKNGPGHIAIGIRPSIQAQSAMLRELYPHGPLAAGPAGPLPAP